MNDQTQNDCEGMVLKVWLKYPKGMTSELDEIQQLWVNPSEWSNFNSLRESHPDFFSDEVHQSLLTLSTHTSPLANIEVQHTISISDDLDMRVLTVTVESEDRLDVLAAYVTVIMNLLPQLVVWDHPEPLPNTAIVDNLINAGVVDIYAETYDDCDDNETRIFVKNEFLVQIHPGGAEAENILVDTLIPLWSNGDTWVQLKTNIDIILEVLSNPTLEQDRLNPLEQQAVSESLNRLIVTPPVFSIKSKFAELAKRRSNFGHRDAPIHNNVTNTTVFRIEMAELNTEEDETLLSFVLLNTLVFEKFINLADRFEEIDELRDIQVVQTLLSLSDFKVESQLNTYTAASACAHEFGRRDLPIPVYGDPIQPIIEGGPGSVPVRYVPPITGHIPYNFQLSTLNPSGGPDNKGEGATVFILDTMPSKLALDTALIRWPQHPLLKSLWNSDNCLTLISALTEAEKNMRFAALRHPLNDHGLFIAGLVRSVAPKAKIYLVEMLNEYGVSTSEDALAAFLATEQIIIETQCDKAIINCSWHLPSQPSVNTMLSRTTLDQASVSVLTSRAQVYSGLLSNQLTGLVEESNNPDPSREIVIVASAGNNTLKAKSTDTFPPRAQTNAPASFKSVYGVGALNQNFSLTPYSSEPDSGNPVNNIYDPGFAIFGGEVTEPINFPNNKPLLITDMDKGILGLCITDFVTALNGSTDPAEWSWQFNQYGWGRWAGASFATGVMSGIVALLASNGYWQSNPPTTSSTDRAYIKVIERIVQLLQDPTSPNPPTKPYIIKIHQA